MIRLLLALACWIGLVPAMAANETVALFNGKTLDGWTFDIIDSNVKPDEVWSVVDGILVCKGRPPGVIRTGKDYENYEIVIEWRWPIWRQCLCVGTPEFSRSVSPNTKRRSTTLDMRW